MSWGNIRGKLFMERISSQDKIIRTFFFRIMLTLRYFRVINFTRLIIKHLFMYSCINSGVVSKRRSGFSLINSLFEMEII